MSHDAPQKMDPTIRPAYSASVARRTSGYPRHSFATAGMMIAMPWSPGVSAAAHARTNIVRKPAKAARNKQLVLVPAHANVRQCAVEDLDLCEERRLDALVLGAQRRLGYERLGVVLLCHCE